MTASAGLVRGARGAMAKPKKDSKFEVFGQEMIEKTVSKSGNSGRIYLPPDWIGKRVKIIRVE
jgi:putative transposon-encoded protein